MMNKIVTTMPTEEEMKTNPNKEFVVNPKGCTVWWEHHYFFFGKPDDEFESFETYDELCEYCGVM